MVQCVLLKREAAGRGLDLVPQSLDGRQLAQPRPLAGLEPDLLAERPFLDGHQVQVKKSQ